MAVFIRAVSTRSLEPLGPHDLLTATESADFVTFAENQGLEGALGTTAREALRVEGQGAALGAALLFYGGAPRFVRVERRVGPQAGAQIEELLRALPNGHAEPLTRVRGALHRAVEVVSLELQRSDVKGMGWPIAFQTAMWLAARGEGLVCADATWWDPLRYERMFG